MTAHRSQKVFHNLIPPSIFLWSKSPLCLVETILPSRSPGQHIRIQNNRRSDPQNASAQLMKMSQSLRRRHPPNPGNLADRTPQGMTKSQSPRRRHPPHLGHRHLTARKSQEIEKSKSSKLLHPPDPGHLAARTLLRVPRDVIPIPSLSPTSTVVHVNLQKKVKMAPEANRPSMS